MKCPKCGSENVFVQAVTETKQKAKKGLLYWLFIGWWWELFAWLFLTLPKLIIAIFGNHKKTVSKTSTQAVCQNCGNRWVVSNSQIKQAAQQNETHTVQQNVLRPTADQPIDVAASNNTEENTMEKIKNFFKSTGALFKTNTGNMIFVCIVSLFLGAILFGGGGDKAAEPQKDTATPAVVEQTTDTATPAQPADEASGKLGKYNVTIKDFELKDNYEGKPSIIVSFDFTNNSDDSQSLEWAVSYKAYQNGVELEHTYIDGANADVEVLPGYSTEEKTSWILSDATSPVTVICTELISFDDTKITKTFEIA